MTDFKDIIEYCKKLSKAILKGSNTDNLDTPSSLSKKDERDIVKSLNDTSYWEKREADLKAIDTEADWKKLEEKITVTKVRKIHFWRYAAAAVVLIGVGIGVFYKTPLFKNADNTVEIQQEIVAGSDKAILSLDNGEQIELAEETVYTSDDASLQNNKLAYSKGKTSETLRYNYLTIPRGGKFFVELSDGTKVWLNSETQLKFPVQFIAGRSREVELVYGEAYFEVSHSTDHGGDSFVVKQKEQQIEVLGTAFNISAYKNESTIYTTLVNGSVALSKAAAKEILKPGQQAKNTINTSRFDIYEADVAGATAWKDGLFMFNDETLEDMMIQLARWYDVEVAFENEDKKQYTFSGTLQREDHIAKLLNNLEKTGEVQFEINNKRIMIK